MSIPAHPDRPPMAQCRPVNEARNVSRWWVVIVAGAAGVLLVAWLGRLAGVSPAVLWSVGAAFAALTWMIVLVTVPWNLFFAARHVVAEAAVSRERGIVVRPNQDGEARRIARVTLWFAIGGHIGTAAVAAIVAQVSGAVVGYYIAGFFLLSTTARPALAYFAHLRQKITALAREVTHPRADVVTLTRDVIVLRESVEKIRDDVREHRRTAATDLRHATSGVAADIAHLRQQVSTDLARLEDAQAADRTAARAREDDLRRTLEQMVRRIDATLDGISDHQELLTGLRALVRMIRSDPA
jgi:hypothetical protein